MKDIKDYLEQTNTVLLTKDAFEWLKERASVLDKVRAEIHATAELHEDGDYYLRDEWIDEIFDKYKAESTSEIPNKCEDCISRQAVFEQVNCWIGSGEYKYTNATDYLTKRISKLPFVTSKQKMGHCKECKYFECDSVAKVDGIPLIVAHEICSKWGGGCKTKEDGYCFLYEPQESGDKE